MRFLLRPPFDLGSLGATGRNKVPLDLRLSPQLLCDPDSGHDQIDIIIRFLLRSPPQLHAEVGRNITIRIIKIKKKIIVKVIICTKCLAILHTKKKIDLFELTEIVVENKRSRNLIKFTRFWLNQNSD